MLAAESRKVNLLDLPTHKGSDAGALIRLRHIQANPLALPSVWSAGFLSGHLPETGKQAFLTGATALSPDQASRTLVGVVRSQPGVEGTLIALANPNDVAVRYQMTGLVSDSRSVGAPVTRSGAGRESYRAAVRSESVLPPHGSVSLPAGDSGRLAEVFLGVTSAEP